MKSTVTENKKELPVMGQYDVIVCGGGIAGISAALASSRNELLLIRTKTYVSGRGRNSPAVLPVDQAGFLRTSLRKASSSSAVGTLTMPT